MGMVFMTVGGESLMMGGDAMMGTVSKPPRKPGAAIVTLTNNTQRNGYRKDKR